MGRKPIGETTMTGAERVRRLRKRRAAAGARTNEITIELKRLVADTARPIIAAALDNITTSARENAAKARTVGEHANAARFAGAAVKVCEWATSFLDVPSDEVNVRKLVLGDRVGELSSLAAKFSP